MSEIEMESALLGSLERHCDPNLFSLKLETGCKRVWGQLPRPYFLELLLSSISRTVILSQRYGFLTLNSFD
jgi:hypothetical protein